MSTPPPFDLDACFTELTEPTEAPGFYFIFRDGGVDYSELKPPGFTQKIYMCRAVWHVNRAGGIYVLKNRFGKVGACTSAELRRIKEGLCCE